MMSIKEAVAFLRDTPYPANEKQLDGWLRRSGAACARRGRENYYRLADILELHRDHADRQIATS